MDLWWRTMITFCVVSAVLLTASSSSSVKADSSHGVSQSKWMTSYRDKRLTVMDFISMANEMSNNVEYQGDIVLTDRDQDIDTKVRIRRNSVRQKRKLWSHRVIPYEITAGLENYKRNIFSAISEFEKYTCLKFKKRTNEKHWIKFNMGRGCWSYIGRVYWRKEGQELSLGHRCNSKKIIMHELMHAIGFWHEQSRHDRDKYVEILWENIKDGMDNQFNKYKQSKIDNMDFEYDYNSLMHYGSRTFSKNGKATVRAINRPHLSLGRRSGFSNMDVDKINAVYDCKNKNSLSFSEWSSFTPCNGRCIKYRQRVCFSVHKVHCPGIDSHGVRRERVRCSPAECESPIDGHWGRWASWTVCSKRCGAGTQVRTRKCDDPEPRFGGKPCKSAATEERVCNMQPCLDDIDSCNFDSDFCSWTNSFGTSSSFNWRRGKDLTPSKNTGPTGDHTTGIGYYLYIETSYPARRGYKSHLLSKRFPPTEQRCLSWWYNMNGNSIGALNVYKVKGYFREMIWTKSGNQGGGWMHASKKISSNSNYQIIFEGVRGAGYTGDIAIDDISFDSNPCKEDVVQGLIIARASRLATVN